MRKLSLQDLQSIKNNFLNELKKAEQGEASSLSWFVNQIPEQPVVPDDEEFQVLVIGGSNCRCARVKRNGRRIVMIENEHMEQPVFDTKERFVEFILKQLHENTSVLALNFAFPLQPVFDGYLDGVLERPAKEHKFEGLVGERVGKTIEEYVQVQTGRSIKVSVANDTVCLLLAGSVDYTNEELACGIVGTGMNAAFFIDPTHLVNLESGSFNKFDHSISLKKIDSESTAPGQAMLEKTVTGGYLYKYFNLTAPELGVSEIKSTEELNQIAETGEGKAQELAQSVISRSAEYVGCQFAAVAEFRKRNLVSVMEGSLFWKGMHYRETVEKVVGQLTQYQVKFVEIPDSTIIGAAKLVA